jgi:hypothetical protein
MQREISTEEIDQECFAICEELTNRFVEESLGKYDGDKLVTYLIQELAKARLEQRK